MVEYKNLRRQITQVIPLIEKRIAEFPKYPPYKHALEQVRLIDSLASKEITPSTADRDGINLCIMCVKTLDEIDRELSTMLYEIAGRFDALD